MDTFHEEDLDWEEYDASRGSFGHHMVAGSIAGISEHVLMFPLDTFKTHQQFHKGSNQGISFWNMLKTEGFFRLWRGAPVTAAACVPSHAAYFTCYEWMKRATGADLPGHRPMEAAISGASATIIHDAIMTPMDVMKQRLQLGYYRGIAHCFRTILQQEGLKAFYRSYPTTVLMNIPYAATAVAANESLKKLLTSGGQEATLTTYLLSGAGAGAVAAAATCPLDVIKTRLQTQSLAYIESPSSAGNSAAGCGAASTSTSGSSGGGAAGGTAGSSSSMNSSSGSSSSTSGGASSSSRGASASISSYSAQPAAAAGKPQFGFTAAPVPAGTVYAQAGAGVRAGVEHCAATARRAYSTSCALYSSATGSSPAAQVVTRLTSAQLARRILAEEGFSAFFKGVGARMLVHTPSMAVSWGTYEAVKSLLVQFTNQKRE